MSRPTPRQYTDDPIAIDDPFSANPFRVLRLAATATPQEVQARYAEERIAVKLSSRPDVEARLDELRQAQVELLDPKKRLLHEAGWFYRPSTLLFDGVLPRGKAILEGYEERSSLPGNEGICAKHDTANWLLALACHEGKTGLIKQLSRSALAAWSDLLADPTYTRLLTVTSPKQHSDKGDVWKAAVLTPLALAIHRRAKGRDIEAVTAYVEAAREQGIDQRDLQALVKPALECFQDDLRQIITKLGKERASTELTGKLAGEWAAMIKRCVAFLQSLCTDLDQSFVAPYLHVLDDAALFLRSVAVDLTNKLDLVEESLRLVTLGQDIGVSVDVRDKLQTDIRTLSYRQALSRSVALAKNQQWDEGKKAAQQALTYAATDEERKQASEIEVAIRQREENGRKNASGWWKKLLVPAGIVAAIILVNVCNNSSDSTSNVAPSAPTPTTFTQPTQAPQRPIDTGATERARVLAQIDTNKLGLAQLERQIGDIETSMNNLDSQMKALMARYPSRQLPEPQYSQYNDLVRRYNSYLSQQQDLVEQYDSLLAATNRLIDRYNAIR